MQKKRPQDLCLCACVCMCVEYTHCHSDEIEEVEGQISKHFRDEACLPSRHSDASFSSVGLFCTSRGCLEENCTAQMLLFQSSGEVHLGYVSFYY